MNHGEPATTVGVPQQTEVGSVFVSNYPPYSFWGADGHQAAKRALESAPRAGTPLGLYLHIPFCRKRCKFCYFKVYTDKNSREVERYLDTLAREVEGYVTRPALAGRPPKFVYFGGGTPSFISARHLRGLVQRLNDALPWQGVAEEVTFEVEPGTLTRPKLEAIREVGITRLSLGVESFDDEILRENGRAHVSKEIFRVVPWIQQIGFEQWNLDLIAGMLGETWDSWQDSVQKTIDMQPDSVTVYQMELPYNTIYSQDVLRGRELPVADWAAKRSWHDYAFEQLEAAGYEISSAYTMVRRGKGARFVYRDSVWHGCDMLGAGVSSFSHIGGVHFQNVSRWDNYLGQVEAGELPIERGYATSARERLTREMILQLKLGSIRPSAFEQKFGKRILDEFAPAFEKLEREQMLIIDGDEIRLTRPGLLSVDQLLPEFYAPEHRNARYT